MSYFGQKNNLNNVYKTMSSVLRSIASRVAKNNKFDNISTLSYNDEDLGETVPVPFTVNNGILDIEITNDSVQNFVTNGVSPDDEGDNDDSEYQAKMMGGLRLIQGIGSTLERYLRKLINNNEDLSGSYTGAIDLFIPPVMTKVQLAQPSDVKGLTFENVYGVNDKPPSSDEYVGGEVSNKYYTSWVFKNPMTIRYATTQSSTGYRYMTFSTHYDGD